MKNKAMLIAALTITSSVFANNSETKSKIVIEKKTKSSAEVLVFKTVKHDERSFTLDAPWQLTIKNPKGFHPAKMVFKKSDLEKNLPGFRVPITNSSNKISFEYEMRTFVCTLDKSMCFPEKHTGTYSSPI